uniref:NADH-ubiquinone oxidoreductase chain 6 n=2 Tax=Pterocladia TaxID=28859 RepID=A0A1D8X7R4_9FLOR|nr:NADH dehydrogenase subunit 6 [Pterocladia mexicana]YP_009317654.1 NADH dehydrogenase subunit 6 [Pterocladia robusta]YP_011017043.1 NADH dehydrogenase subunit 6 [Pterocladiella capillacea]AOX49060.1 NADH dehydrogenase subunit 6 [Pterocladia mexicana]AOX49106.1 NADH dehydrogenase subunit 6 [Pterocladia robusta]WQB61721.1 NADH dehydrogenase subunit 6 [Pterocladiella capillacea]
MNIETFLSITFSLFALLSALMVITLTNAVHSVLFLILVFCNVAGLLLLFGVEFLSFMLLIVYVGAIAVLFLFVVMMLNVKINSSSLNSVSLIPIGIFIILLFSYQLSLTIDEFNLIKVIEDQPKTTLWINEINNISNIKVIGKVLYTNYSLLFLISSLILLVAMIGAIVLTMHQRTDVKKQKIEYQLIRKATGVVKFVTLRK